MFTQNVYDEVHKLYKVWSEYDTFDEIIYLAVENLNGYFYLYKLDFFNDKAYILPIYIDDAVEEHQKSYGFSEDEAIEVVLNNFLDQAGFLDGWLEITNLKQV